MLYSVANPTHKYIVFCLNRNGIKEIGINSDFNAIVAAKHWASTNKGDREAYAACYCVQDGLVSDDRPFHKEYAE